MHDEKKIEELLEQNSVSFDIWRSEQAMKQYAEHMVQQERERILKIVKLLEFNAPKKYDVDPTYEQAGLLNKHIMPVVRDIIIKAINQE